MLLSIYNGNNIQTNNGNNNGVCTNISIFNTFGIGACNGHSHNISIKNTFGNNINKCVVVYSMSYIIQYIMYEL